MFGMKARGRNTTKQVQSWVDDGMELMRDGAKQPMMWGAALSVALAALVGYSAYRQRDNDAAPRRTPRSAPAKTMAARTRKAGRRVKPTASGRRGRRKTSAAKLDE